MRFAHLLLLALSTLFSLVLAGGINPGSHHCPANRQCARDCCDPGEACIKGRCTTPCLAKRACGHQCCPEGEECSSSGDCQPPCPRDRKCGRSCCNDHETCLFGNCVNNRCPDGRSKCGILGGLLATCCSMFESVGKNSGVNWL